MGRTVGIREAIQAKLLTFCTSVSFREKKGPVNGNYIVWTIGDFVRDENITQTMLEVYVNGINASTESVENLADTVWEGLDHWLYAPGTIGFEVYQNTRSNMGPDFTDSVSRRLLFTLRIYE